MSTIIPTPTPRRVPALALGFLVGLGIGVLLGRYALAPAPAHTDVSANTPVTRENYLKIQPGMSSWEVNDILGTGEVVAEEELVIDAAGQFKKRTRVGKSYEEETGAVPAGRARRESKQEVVWRKGDKSIKVTFVDEKVTNKKEERLYAR